MSKGKALAPVSEAEQPYLLPEGWKWVRLGEIADKFQYGYTASATNVDTGTHYIRITDIGEGVIDIGNAPFCDISKADKPKYIIQKDDIFIARMGSVGENGIALSNLDAVFASYLIRVQPKTNAKFFVLYLQSNLYWNQISDNSKGTTRLNVNANVLRHLIFPLPPLPTQQKIVAHIESLFEKLDRARELLVSAKESFATRRAAILHKAFTGELTAEWRAEHGVGLESWERKPLGKCGILERGRSKHRPRNAPELFGGVYPFIQTGDIANSEVYVTQHIQSLSEIGLKQSRMFPKGTLCITIAANIGDVAILSYDCCFPDSVVGFTPNSETNSKCIYYMMSVLQQKLEAEAPATAQKNINLKILNDLIVHLPPLLEQQEIVRILDSLFAQEQKAQELADAIEKVDMMKKAVLARAFRGELES